MPKIIVSFTSYPKRMKTVHKVVESLINQTICADEIILFLSILEFPQREEDLPVELLNMIGKKGFKIEWVEDNLKSHKKYYYALQYRSDSIVITVDDDIIYAKTLISDLIGSYEKFPFAVSARRARIILKHDEQFVKYRDWDSYLEKYANVPRIDLCAIGVGGVLYPPYCASREWFSKGNIEKLAKDQDDLWLKYNEIREKIPVVFVSCSQKDIPIENEQISSLSTQNMYGGDNDICVQKLREYAINYNLKVYKKWFEKLMQQEEYILQKKKYFTEKIWDFFGEYSEIDFYLFGAGKRAKVVLEILKDAGVKERIKGIIVSDKQNNPTVFNGIEVKQIDEIDQHKEFGVVCGVSETYKDEIFELLKQYNFRYMDVNFKEILRYYTV